MYASLEAGEARLGLASLKADEARGGLARGRQGSSEAEPRLWPVAGRRCGRRSAKEERKEKKRK